MIETAEEFTDYLRETMDRGDWVAILGAVSGRDAAVRAEALGEVVKVLEAFLDEDDPAVEELWSEFYCRLPEARAGFQPDKERDDER